MNYSLEAINQMTQPEFIRCFGHLFEETPAIAQQAWITRPFKGLNDLHDKMVAIVHKMTPDEKLSLICAHPELGERVQMAAASVREQASARLDQLNAEDYQRIRTLNAAYKEKFDFPFVVAVKGLAVKDILVAMEARLGAQREEEMARSLSEICKIARFRLEALIAETV
ncbi:MAG: 2-oxo-4-hydroxy-4-carboxy-5-ureidoimidazoline decarboxylase [Cyanobacteria bacterium J06650_10]